MNFATRVKLYKELQEKRKNYLIVYVTSGRPGATGAMAADVITELVDQLQALPAETKEIDLLIESGGGDPLVSWRAIALLRSRVEKLNILVPFNAFSAATLLALGADTIVMGRYGSLGPIDPQITVTKKDGMTQAFAYEDIVSFLGFTREEAGLTEQSHIEAAFKILCETVEPSTLGFARRSSSLSNTIGEKLLLTHLKEPEQKTQAGVIAQRLNKSFFSHGHALSRHEAKTIGLNIIEPDSEEERLMWEIHESFDNELKVRTPFNPLADFLADQNAQPYLSSPPPINLPSNVDQNTVNQLLMNYFNSQVMITPPKVVVELKHAFVESLSKASEFYSKQQILATRLLDLTFKVNMVALEGGWREVTRPTEKT